MCLSGASFRNVSEALLDNRRAVPGTPTPPPYLPFLWWMYSYTGKVPLQSTHCDEVRIGTLDPLLCRVTGCPLFLRLFTVVPTEVVRGCDDNQQDRMVGGDHGVLCGSHGHACRQIKELGCVAESAPLGPGEDALCRVCRNRRNHEAETRFYKSSALNRPPGGLGRYVHTLKVHVWGGGG